MLLVADFYPNAFVYSRFPKKIQFLYCLVGSVAPLGGPMVDTKGKIFWNLGLEIFSWIFLEILEFYGEFWRKVD